MTAIMNMYKENKKNLIVLITFATVFAFAIGFCIRKDEISDITSSAEFSSTTLVTTITNETAAAAATTTVNLGLLDNNQIDTDFTETAMNDVSTAALTSYNVVAFDAPTTMYASDTVNVRLGAGTDYERIGKVAWGTAMSVLGATDNGWYEVTFKDMKGFIRGDYMVTEIPGIPYLFVGDSRTVQMQLAVGSSDKAYIAKVGEGYSYFKDTAIAAIPQYAGKGTTMIINFGVNDLRNAKKYVNLVNSYMDAWTDAGITVYYSAVTPVGSSASVSNSQIESFNTTLKEGLDPRVHWIDSYTYLQQVGFSTSDGLHYNKDTYKNLYSYYMAVISQDAAQSM